MPNRKVVKVAVIGAGNMGRYHVRNYLNLPNVQLAAIADLNPATEQLAKEHGIKHYTDFKVMLDEVKPDAVSVVVPTPFHSTIGKEVMRRGIHCLIEKPIASSVREADELIALSKKAGLVFSVGHIERYNPVVRKLKELIDKNKLGTITSVVSRRVGGFPQQEPKTDVIIDLAVHDIDIMNYLLGRYPKKVSSHTSRTLHTTKVDAAEILLDYGNTSGFVQANWITPVKIRTIAVTGSKGYAEANYITQELVHYENNMKRVRDDFKTFIVTLGEPKKRDIKIGTEEPLAVELRHFINQVRGKKGYQLVEPKDAREALRIALEAMKEPKGKKA